MNQKTSIELNCGLVVEVRADGMAIDLSSIARARGFKVPLFMTEGAFEQYVVRAPDLNNGGELRSLEAMIKFLRVAWDSRESDVCELNYCYYRPGNPPIQTVELVALVVEREGMPLFVMITLPGE